MYISDPRFINRIPGSLISVILSVACFYLVNGFEIVNPANIAWLCCGDPAQHYLGWVFFRNDVWHFPPGLNPNFGMELGSSIVYADAIPLLAIALKPFSNLLPETFQYLGLWALACFVLQGLLAWNLIGLKIQDRLIQSCGVILYIINPVFLSWSIAQAISAHFLVLIALYLNIAPFHLKHLMVWLALLWSATLIHFYILVMIGILFVANLLDLTIFQKKISAIKASIILVAALFGIFFLAWLSGYFVIDTHHALTNNYGKWKINILGLFDPYGWSYVIPSLPKTKLPGVSNFDFEINFLEGNNFLGLGAIFLLVIALYLFLIKKQFLILEWRNKYGFVLAVGFLCLFAITHQIGIGPFNITIPIPDQFIALGSVLRGAGRMFWAVYYLILLVLIWQNALVTPKRKAQIILMIAVLLQIGDTSAYWLKQREKIITLAVDKGPPLLANQMWSNLIGHYRNLIHSPWEYRPGGMYPIGWEPWAHFAAKAKMATNATYLSRFDDSRLTEAFERFRLVLKTGNYDSDTLYILKDDEVIPALAKLKINEDLFIRLDNFNVVAPRWNICKDCPDASVEFAVTNFVPQVKIGSPVIFSRAGDRLLPFVLLSGWDYPQPWGVWAVGPRARLNLPLPAGSPQSLVLDLRALINAQLPQQIIHISVNDQLPLTYTLAQEEHNQIVIPLDSKIWRDGYVSLSFDLPDAKKPKEIGIGLDERLLSVGLISATFF